MATDQCSEHQFSSPFYPGDSCEEIYNKNPQSHERSGYYWILDGPSKVYCGMSYTGSSCLSIYNSNPETIDKPGFYRINDSEWTYCNMTSIVIGSCGSVGEGWRRIANIDIGAGGNCPSGWIKATDISSGVSFCRVADADGTNICSSAYFSTAGTSYQRVCGRARGYQKGYVWAFDTSSESIEASYVSGLSLTYGTPRRHIWTYATGLAETVSTRCPCEGGSSPPSFVGNNLYCESGTINHPPSSETFFFDDALWDGAGCFSSHVTCCDNTNQPWFYRQLDHSTQDNIEARICVVGPFSRSATVIDQLDLYIQ